MNVNIYNPYVRQELELYHHGILGQRWGKKNGPPYPLNSSDHSASEKKAGWRKSLSDGGEKDYSKRNAALAGKYKAKADKARAIAKEYEGTAKGNDYKQKTKEYDKLSKKFSDAGSEKIARYTPEQIDKGKKIAKTAIKVGGGVALAALAGYVGYRHSSDIAKAYEEVKTRLLTNKLINSANDYETTKQTLKDTVGLATSNGPGVAPKGSPTDKRYSSIDNYRTFKDFYDTTRRSNGSGVAPKGSPTDKRYSSIDNYRTFKDFYDTTRRSNGSGVAPKGITSKSYSEPAKDYMRARDGFMKALDDYLRNKYR